MSVNKVILIGNVINQPVKRYTPSGAAVTTFRMATNESYTDKNKVKQKKSEYHNIVVWNKLAEICADYLHTGKQIYIEGKISTRQYEKEGQTHFFTEIIAFTMQMLGKKGDDQRGSEPDTYQNTYNQNKSYDNNDSSNQGSSSNYDDPTFNVDDEIPF